jgi:hypothetical protein
MSTPSASPSGAPWAAAFAEGDPSTLSTRCLEQLGDTAGATLGILYVSEPTALVLPLIARELAAATGISSWVGGVGLGVSAAGQEV